MCEHIADLTNEQVNFAQWIELSSTNLGLVIFPDRQKKDQASKIKEVENIMANLEIESNQQF